MAIFLNLFYPPTIPKERVLSIRTSQRKLYAILLISFDLLIGIIQSFFIPKLSDMYRMANLGLPAITRWSLIAGIIGVVLFSGLAFYLMCTGSDNQALLTKLKKDKRETIPTCEILDIKNELFLCLLVILILGYLFTSIILPINTLYTVI